MTKEAADTMPPWQQRLVSELDAADARAKELAKGLSRAQLNWKPRPDVWSVGQCLEHLCLSNDVYVEPITIALRRRPTGPVDEITPGWFGRWFLTNFIEPTTQKKRTKAPGKAVPVTQQIEPAIVERFIASNAAMRELMARAQGHDVNRVRFKNPFVSWIRFTVGTGFQIIARHSHRHLNQAERVKQLQDFPRT